MHTTTNAQMGLPDSSMIATPINEFLERLDGSLGWKPIEQALLADVSGNAGTPALRATGAVQNEPAPALLRPVRPAVRGAGQRPSELAEVCGFGITGRRAGETTLGRFRQWLREHGLHEKLLALVNRQL